jgi:16S rRNA (cytosine1402-N4)-methyltransferase
MLSAVLERTAEQSGIYVDCTFGRGGYTQALLDQDPRNSVIAIDRDPEAIAWGTHHLVPLYKDRLTLIHGRFADLDTLLTSRQTPPVQGIIFDLGVSSPQLDQGERGFSFMRNGPLHMGMGLNTATAAQFINQAPVEEIETVLKVWGEERHARKLAQKIGIRRQEAPFETTQDLVTLIQSVIPQEPSGLHPATRTFQALRLWVNQELAELTRALEVCAPLLAPQGQIIVVSFHSLEDRIVKHFFALQGKPQSSPNRHLPGPATQTLAEPLPLRVPGKQPLLPTREESRRNPRARSARLRYAIKREESVG